MDPRHPFELEFPPVEPGLNQWVWDFRRDGVHCIEDVKIFAGFGGATVPPARYRARITAAGESREAAFTLVHDARLTATRQEFAEWSARVDEAEALLDTVLRHLERARRARSEVESLMADHPESADLQEAGHAAVEALTAAAAAKWAENRYLEKFSPVSLAIVTDPEVKAVVSPVPDADPVVDLPPGSEVRLLLDRGQWQFVAIPDDLRGLRKLAIHVKGQCSLRLTVSLTPWRENEPKPDALQSPKPLAAW